MFTYLVYKLGDRAREDFPTDLVHRSSTDSVRQTRSLIVLTNVQGKVRNFSRSVSASR